MCRMVAEYSTSVRQCEPRKQHSQEITVYSRKAFQNVYPYFDNCENRWPCLSLHSKLYLSIIYLIKRRKRELHIFLLNAEAIKIKLSSTNTLHIRPSADN